MCDTLLEIPKDAVVFSNCSAMASDVWDQRLLVLLVRFQMLPCAFSKNTKDYLRYHVYIIKRQ